MNDPVRLTGQENFISENIPQGSPFALVRVLNMRLASGKLSSTEVALYEHMRKTEIRKTVAGYHKNVIAYDGRKEMFYTRHPADYRKRLYSKTEDALYERLFALYEKEPSLRSCPFLIGTLFENALDWIRNTQNKSDKTLHLHEKNWERYFKGTCLAGIDIRDVTPSNYYDTFVEITKDGHLTKKRFSDLLVCFNYIYEYANIVCSLGLTSPLSLPLFKKLRFKEEEGKSDEIKTQALTKSQIIKLIGYCQSEPERVATRFRPRIIMNRLGIHLDIYLGLRFGELFGLRWQDITTDEESGITTVRVCGQKLPTGEWVPYTKKHTDEGLRELVLVPQGVSVLEQLKSIQLDDTYVFHWEKNAYMNFQRECKRAYAHVLGLKYNAKPETKADRVKLHHYSTHTNRTTFASVLYDSGTVTDRQLQQLMGHTTSDMTRRYCHDIRGKEALQKAQIEAFGCLDSKDQQAS